jgi:hypothetical protein
MTFSIKNYHNILTAFKDFEYVTRLLRKPADFSVMYQTKSYL